MKTIEWQKTLEEYMVQGKKLFTVAELANIANVSHHALNVELARLVKRHVLERYARGIYGLPKKVTPNELVRSLDTHAYITAFSALFQQGMVTQIPTVYTCFNRSAAQPFSSKANTFGTFRFHNRKKVDICASSGFRCRPCMASIVRLCLYDAQTGTRSKEYCYSP